MVKKKLTCFFKGFMGYGSWVIFFYLRVFFKAHAYMLFLSQCYPFFFNFHSFIIILFVIFYRLFFYCFGFLIFFNLPISPPLIHTPLLAGGYKGGMDIEWAWGSGQKAGKHATGQRRRSMG